MNNLKKKYQDYENIIIITDDGEESDNTFLFHTTMLKMNKNSKLFYTEKKVSAKSNSISLDPIKFRKNGTVFCIDCFPADCLLFNIFNCNYQPSNTLFILGVNEHNHFGYGNYVSSTTSLLLLAKHFRYKAFAVSSEIYLNEDYITDFYYFATSLTEVVDQYISFNINILNMDFQYAKVSEAKFDKYERLETNRGLYLLLTYNQNLKDFKEGTDGWFQVHKKNYIVELF